MHTAIIFIGLIGLMVMAYRGASIILIAPVFAVVAALGSEHASLPIFSELYMTKAAEYLKNYYPIFLFGAIFARLMEKGGMAASVAGKIIELLGEKRAVLAVLLGCGVLTYGGLSVFVVAFGYVSIGAVSIQEASHSKETAASSSVDGYFLLCYGSTAWYSADSEHYPFLILWYIYLVWYGYRYLCFCNLPGNGLGLDFLPC